MSNASRKIFASRLSHLNEAGRNEEIHESVQLERADSVRIQLARFVTYYNNFQPVPYLEVGDHLDHSWIGFGLGEHESSKLRPRERALLIEDHQAKILFECELALFVDLESHPMPRFHRRPRQLEVGGRASAGMMIPPVREQDTADIYKRAGYLRRTLHFFANFTG